MLHGARENYLRRVPRRRSSRDQCPRSKVSRVSPILAHLLLDIRATPRRTARVKTPRLTGATHAARHEELYYERQIAGNAAATLDSDVRARAPAKPRERCGTGMRRANKRADIAELIIFFF